MPPALRDLARAQEGAVTLAQCRMGGLGEKSVRGLVANGLWQRVGRGLLVTHPGELEMPTRRWLALLAAGDGAALGLETAAALQKWGRATDEVVVVVPAARRQVQPGPWTVVRTRLDFRTRGTPAMTTPERTALDLVRAHPDRAVATLTDVVNSRRTTPRRLLRELEKFGAFPRRDFVKGLLGDVDDGALSVLEMMWLRDVERAHGLPAGARQTSSRAGLRDVRYGRLLVELDGRLGHEGSGAFRDMHRDNVHVLQGETTLRFGFHDVDTRSCACAAMVARALQLMGNRVDVHPCGPVAMNQQPGWNENGSCGHFRPVWDAKVPQEPFPSEISRSCTRDSCTRRRSRR